MATGFRLNPTTIKEGLKTSDVREQDSKTPAVSRLEGPNISPISYLPGSVTKTTHIFNRVKEEVEDALGTMENKLGAYHKARETTTRLGSLENFMKNQQAVQIGMQKQQADFLEQHAIFMQQVLQQMGPDTADKQITDDQITQNKDKQIKQHTQIKQNKQPKERQKTDEKRYEQQERTRLGIVGSSSAPAMGAWQDTNTLFVELEAACYLAQTDPNAYSCKDKKLTIDHYTKFLWYKEHDQAVAFEGLEQPHAEKLAGAAFEARVQEHMSALSHISNPSQHTKLMISLY